jgi:hypothetical protein
MRMWQLRLLILAYILQLVHHNALVSFYQRHTLKYSFSFTMSILTSTCAILFNIQPTELYSTTFQKYCAPIMQETFVQHNTH